MNIKVIPGILESNFDGLSNKLLRVSDFSDKVFVDVIDGRFTENETIGMDELMDSSTELGIWIHLMTEEPINYLNQCREVGAELVVGQVELMEDQVKFIKEGKHLGVKTGLALDLATPVDFLEEEALGITDTVLLMAVEAGFSGQEFDEGVLKKIRELREGGFEGDIFVDGGVNEKTIGECVKAGANGFSVTSGIWQADNQIKAYANLLKMAQK